MAVTIPKPGDVLADKYLVTRFLGKGGMGIVVEARHLKLDQRFAVKLLLPDALERSDSLPRFEQEARAAARLRSPHVVRVVDVDTTSDGSSFIVMEYLEGNDLASELRRRPVLPTTEAVDILLQACAAMAEAHACGIVHRDIKPSNLFLCRTEGASRVLVKVMDFGVSKVLEGGLDLTTSDTTIGTPNYMAPEQLLTPKAVDTRADVWSLGVVLYRMLSGTLPFQASSPTALAAMLVTSPPVPLSQVAPHVPPELAAAVMAALERDVARRVPDVTTFGRAIERFGAGGATFASLAAARSASLLPPHEAHGLSVTPPPNPPPRRSHRPFLLLALGLAATFVLGVVGVTATRKSAAAPVVVRAPSSASAPIAVVVPVEAAPVTPLPAGSAPPSGAPSASAPPPKPFKPRPRPIAPRPSAAPPVEDPPHL